MTGLTLLTTPETSIDNLSSFDSLDSVMKSKQPKVNHYARLALTNC
jgi:hypothetical protein